MFKEVEKYYNEYASAHLKVKFPPSNYFLFNLWFDFWFEKILYICPMKKWLITSFLFVGLILTSCIDIVDDLTLNADGSGTFKYTINLSSSKAKINSILALDSLDGKPVPSKDDIRLKINEFKIKLAQKEGIKNVFIEEDYTNYFFKLSCDFDEVGQLQDAIKKTINEILKHSKNEFDEHQWVVLVGNTLSRSVPQAIVDQAKKLKREDSDLLKQGSYTSITRFEKEIEKFDNESAQLSKNKKALMLRVNTHSLLNNVSLMGNKIYLAE